MNDRHSAPEKQRHRSLILWPAGIALLGCAAAVFILRLGKEKDAPGPADGEQGTEPEWQLSYPVYAGLCADLDSDGVFEDLTLSFGPTSGLYTVTVTATVEGEIKYMNTFNTDPFLIGLEEKNGLVYAVKGERMDGDDPEKRSYLKLSVESGRIVLEDPEKGRGEYWGGYQWNRDLQDNACDCRVAGVYEVGWTDDPQFMAESVNSDTLISDARHLPVYVFRSEEELDGFVGKWNGTLDLQKAFSDAEKPYDSSFFEQNVLMAAYLDTSSMSFRYEVSFVQKLYEGITLFAARTNFPETFDCAMDGWLMVVEIPCGETDGDTVFDAVQMPGPRGEY